ncbi:MAG: hypothetical protein LUG18_07895 [Candidatus Azobacteroides sp.]|nr:hypothetical protein [Candidatus Azobacteroides sp.]
MKKKTFLLLIACFTISSFYGQSSYQPTPHIPVRNFYMTPPTPMVSQFLRYDELPVSEYTGIPNISIPLYNIEVDDISIPVTLSYHASGIKVNQDASWVGMGWDMSFASIIQFVNDLDDLSTNPIHGAKNSMRNIKQLPNWLESSQSTNYGYTFYPLKSSVFASDPTGLPNLNNKEPTPYTVPSEKFSYWITAKKYFTFNKTRQVNDQFYNSTGWDETDSEPDIFKISLFGVTLNVIMDFYSGKFIVLNKKGYKVSIDDELIFTVITPDGDRYIFSESVETHTSSCGNISPCTNGNKTLSKRTWLLTEIKTRNNKEVKFIYEKTTSPLVLNIHSESKDWPLHTYENTYYSSYFANLHNGESILSATDEQKTEIKEVQYYLKNIHAPDVNISFSLANRTDISPAKRLNSITFLTAGYTTVKKVEFNYSYRKNKDSSTRLFLSSLKDNDKNYTFQYNETTLPAKNSYEQDYWGYPNGQSANTSLLPNPDRFGYRKSDGSKLNINSNNKSARLSYTKSGILESIVYPTGGSVHFDYELNEFTNYWVPDSDSLDNKVSKGMGLRVKSITYKDTDGEQIKKTRYKYEKGKAIIKQSVIEEFQRMYHKPVIKKDDAYCTQYVTRLISMSSNGFYEQNPLSSISGVGYEKVIRYQYDKDSRSQGRTELYFNNNPDKVPSQPSGGMNVTTFISLPAFKNSSFPENGTQKKVLVFNQDGTQIKETIFSYTNKKSSLYYGAKPHSYGAWVYWHFIFQNGTAFSVIPLDVVGLYPIFDFESLLSGTTEKEFRNGKEISVSKTYTYNSNNLLSAANQTNYLYTSYKYPQDYTDEDIYKQMVSNNILSPVVETTVRGSNNSIIGKEKVNYIKDTKITNGLFLPGSIDRSYRNGAGTETLITYKKYNTLGNPIEFTTSDGVTTVYLWGYYGLLPIAEIKNASFSTVSNILGDDLTERLINSKVVTNDDYTAIRNLQSHTSLSNAYVSIFNHEPLVGVTRTTAPNGINTYYEYDKRHHLKKITDHYEKPLEVYAFHYQGNATDEITPFPLEITSTEVNGLEITVNFTECDGSGGTTSIIKYYNKSTGDSHSSALGCNGERKIKVPVKGNYIITITIHYRGGKQAQGETTVKV